MNIAYSLTLISSILIYQYVTDVCNLVDFVPLCMFCNVLTFDLLGTLLHVMG